MDEVRISNVARSAQWVAVSSASMRNPAAFAQCGVVNAISSDPDAPLISAAVPEVDTVSVTLRAGIATLHEPATVTLYWGLADGGNDAALWANAITLGFIKTGPGELVLTANNGFIYAYVQEGVVTIPSIGLASADSPLGRATPAPGERGQNLMLGNATLRYKGTDPNGHATDRRVRIGGNATVEASGAGPLAFTNAVPFYPYGIGANRLLTLSGETLGVVTGSFDLRGGRLRKRGPGAWHITSTSHSTNIIWGADVLEGTLILDGTLGRDVTVGYSNAQMPTSQNVQMPPTLTGTGFVARNLIVHANGVISITPDSLLLTSGSSVLTVGKNLTIACGASLALPRKGLPKDWTTVIKVLGKIEGTFDKPPHAYVDYANNEVRVKERPVGTLLMVR